MQNKLENGQIVLCEVTKIVGTTVFAKIEDNLIEGTISFPEIAPGRIRNIRDYAFPGKRIVCKVLSINSNFVELSLRRVKVNERNDFNDLYRKKKSLMAMLRTILKEKAEEIIEKINQNETSLVELLELVKTKPEILEKYMSKEQAQKINSILNDKKVKETILSRKFALSSKASNGINLIKKIIKDSSSNTNAEISYIAAGKYLIKLKTKDLKQGDQILDKIMASIESQAKKQDCSFLEEKD